MYLEYSEPVYRDEQVVVSSYTHRGHYDYLPLVTMENPLYPQGTILDVGKPAYFDTVSPVVDVKLEYELDATKSADLSVEYETVVVATSKGNENEVFWKKTYPVKHDEPVRIKNRETTIHDFSLDIPEIRTNVENVQEQLGFSKDTNIEVLTYVIYEGTINGKTVENTEIFTIPIELSSSYYKIPEKKDFTNTVDTYHTKKVPVNSSISNLKEPLASILFAGSLILLMGIIKKQGKTDPTYIRRLEIEKETEQYADWISNGNLPVKTDSLMEIKINSLKDLLDVAVDMNSRIIYDNNERTYFLIHDGVLYSFSDRD